MLSLQHKVETALTPVNIHASPYLFSFLSVYLFQSSETLNPFIAEDTVALPALDNPGLPLSTLLFPVQVQRSSSSAGVFCQDLGPDTGLCAKPMSRNIRGTAPDGPSSSSQARHEAATCNDQEVKPLKLCMNYLPLP